MLFHSLGGSLTARMRQTYRHTITDIQRSRTGATFAELCGYQKRIWIGTSRPIRVDHTDFFQVAIKTLSGFRRFNTEDDLPIQTLGHIQHTCEALSEIHTLAHHRCWRIIHAELGRLTSSKWRFICISGEKNLRTIWTDLENEFPEVFNLCSAQTLENAVMKQEMDRPMTEAEEKRYTAASSGGKRSR